MNVQNNPIELGHTTPTKFEDLNKSISFSPNTEDFDDLLSDAFSNAITSLKESLSDDPASLTDGYIFNVIKSKDLGEAETSIKEGEKTISLTKQKLDSVTKDSVAAEQDSIDAERDFMDVKRDTDSVIKDSITTRKNSVSTKKDFSSVTKDSASKKKDLESLKSKLKFNMDSIEKLKQKISATRNDLPKGLEMIKLGENHVLIKHHKKKLYFTDNDHPKSVFIDGIEFQCQHISESKKLKKYEPMLNECDDIQDQIDDLQTEIDRMQHEIDEELRKQEEEKDLHSKHESIGKIALKETEKDKRTDESNDKHNRYIENIRFARLIDFIVGSYLFNKHQEDKRNYDRREKESQERHDQIKRTEIKRETLKEERTHKELNLEEIKRSNVQV